MSTCVRKCTFARACNVGANSLNVVSRTFPHFSQSMLTPMQYEIFLEIDNNKADQKCRGRCMADVGDESDGLLRFKLCLPQCNVPGVLNCMSGRLGGFPSLY